MRRPDFLRTGTAAAVALLAPQIARADDAVVRIAALQIDPAAEPYFGQDGGMFKKAGLSVDIQPFTSGVAALAALFGGAIDITIADAVGAASAHSRGLPVTYLAPACVFTRAAQSSWLVVLATSPVKAARDLNGKIVATNGLMNIVQIPTSAWIDNNGGDAKSVHFVELPVPQMPAALDEGRVAAAVMSEPFIAEAQTSGKFRLISLADHNVAPEFLYSGWATTNDWAAKNPDTVRRFVIAMSETAKWANANHALTAPILSRISKVPLEITLKMGRVMFGERFDPAIYQPVIDACAKYGAIAKSFPAAELINSAALR